MHAEPASRNSNREIGPNFPTAMTHTGMSKLCVHKNSNNVSRSRRLSALVTSLKTFALAFRDRENCLRSTES